MNRDLTTADLSYEQITRHQGYGRLLIVIGAVRCYLPGPYFRIAPSGYLTGPLLRDY